MILGVQKWRESNAKEVKVARWCDRGRERGSRCREIAMAEGACLSPQSSMCLSMADLCVCLCLHPQLCHFRNAFHILCRNQREFTGSLQRFSKCLFSLLAPYSCQCILQPLILLTSIEATFSLKHIVITEVCDALTGSFLVLGYDCSCGSCWDFGLCGPVFGCIQVYSVLCNYVVLFVSV